MPRGNRRRVEGVVTSDGMNKSVVVEVKRLVKHPKYKKYIRRRTKLMAHDEENATRLGDRVELIETRPISKRKSWRVLRVVQASHVVAPPDLEKEVAAQLAPHERQAIPEPKAPPAGEAPAEGEDTPEAQATEPEAEAPEPEAEAPEPEADVPEGEDEAAPQEEEKTGTDDDTKGEQAP